MDASTPVKEIFAAHDAAKPDRDYYNENLEAIRKLLVEGHRIPLKAVDLDGIWDICNAFVSEGVTSFRVHDYSPGYTTLMALSDGQELN